MDIFNFEADTRVYCITAKSFPEGVQQAHQSLHALIPYSRERKYFGLSYFKNGSMIYKAAAEEQQKGELSKHELEEFTIKKGTYLFIDVKDFMNHIPEIGKAFQKLTDDHRIDLEKIGVEWYISEHTCRCMMRLNDNS